MNTSPRAAGVGRTARRPPWRIVVPVAVYLVLCLAGVSQSSIGIDAMREDPSEPSGTMLGSAQPIRADEWRTGTPFWLGAMSTGTSEELNPLAGPQAFLVALPDGPVSSVVLLDATVAELGILPDSIAFAAHWWLPFLLLALGAPAFFRNLTGNPRIGWFAVTLIAFSPAAAWWSFAPVASLGVAFAGLAALQNACSRARDGRWLWAAAWSITSAVVLARILTTYPAWSIMLAGSLLVTVVAAELCRRSAWRPTLVGLGGTGALGLVLLALMLRENSAALEIVTNTVYPGARRASGAPVSFQNLFGATQLHDLIDAPQIVETNQSEISSSFAVAFIWVAFLLTRRLTCHDLGHRVAVGVMSTCSVFWLSWAMVEWDRLGVHVPLATQVTPVRAAQVVGFLAVILLCLVLPACPTAGSRRVAVLAAASCALAAAYAGSLLNLVNQSGFTTRSIWIAAVLLGAVVLLITLRPRHPAGYVAAGLLALSLVAQVNPVLFGLADLRGTDTADFMAAAGTQAREEDEVWISDDMQVDALMIATGVPAASGRQMAGPDAAAWRRLIPDPAAEEIWNRGGSYVSFTWTDRPELEIELLRADVILVVGSPCTVAERIPGLRYVVSSRPLEFDCLEQTDTFMWSGIERWVYTVEP